MALSRTDRYFLFNFAIRSSLMLFIKNRGQGLFLKIRAYMQYNQKRAKMSSKRAQLWNFATHFFKFRAFIMLFSPKQHVFMDF